MHDLWRQTFGGLWYHECGVQPSHSEKFEILNGWSMSDTIGCSLGFEENENRTAHQRSEIVTIQSNQQFVRLILLPPRTRHPSQHPLSKVRRPESVPPIAPAQSRDPQVRVRAKRGRRRDICQDKGTDDGDVRIRMR